MGLTDFVKDLGKKIFGQEDEASEVARQRFKVVDRQVVEDLTVNE